MEGDRYRSFLVAQALVDFLLFYGGEEKVSLSVKYCNSEMSQDTISRLSARYVSLMKVHEREKLETRGICSSSVAESLSRIPASFS